MRDKELRLALVCYGGVSLAIYMHGVIKEILKVTRASAAYHAIGDRDARVSASYEDTAPKRTDSVDSEAIWFELFQEIGKKQQVRLVVDAISGASAGGINGIFLARALALDLNIDHQRTMWLENGDVLRLMDEETLAKRWSKAWLHPVLWALDRRRLKAMFPSEEVRGKLKIFLRSRWLEPPFSGERMLAWMVDAVGGMGSYEPGNSLIPPGLRLDLHVSLTNLHGRKERIRLHDPAEVEEREHRTSWSFSHRRWDSGTVESDFTDDNVPILGFAARATSSFPGAFPPAKIDDLNALLSRRGHHWPARASFYDRAFDHLKGTDIDPAMVNYIDGGVVNNKPFADVISSLLSRPAHREVDRRIVYIDPTPDVMKQQTAPQKMGWFRTILAAITDIPRNEPIRHDLQAISDHNSRVQRLHDVIAILRSDIDVLIDGLVTLGDADHMSEPALVASWRERAGTMAAEKAGYSYGNYLHVRTWYLFETLSDRVIQVAGVNGLSADRGQLLTLLTKWGSHRSIWMTSDQTDDMPKTIDSRKVTAFLRFSDVDYRIRRIRFVIMELNTLYSHKDLVGDQLGTKPIDQIKRRLYTYLERLQAIREPINMKLESSGVVSKLLAVIAEPDGQKQSDCFQGMDALFDSIGEMMALEDVDMDLDCDLSKLLAGLGATSVQQSLFRAYIGFAFYDVLTLPLTQSVDLIELEPVIVDRISPVDADTIRREADSPTLKGTSLANFGAFFSRSDRENDYLWGRIQSADRLIDFIMDSVTDDGAEPSFDLLAFRKRLFLSILEGERAHLKADPNLIDSLRAEIEAIQP